MREFAGRVAVITGAGSGIGEAMAWRLAQAGMRIVAADLDAVAAERVAAALVAAGHAALAVRTDVAKAHEVEVLALRAYETFGAVNVLCNNAGVVPAGRYRPVWEYPLEDWQWALDVNLMGIVHGLRSFVPRMLEQGSAGHIVTTASVAGLISGSGSAVYSASKHAAVRVTEALYASLKEQGAPIGVTLLCPGLVSTKIYESERCRPAELMPAAGIAVETAELQAIADELYAHAISPAEVAEQTFAAIRDDQFYVLSTSSYDEAVRDRAKAILERKNPQFGGLLELVKRDIRQVAAR